MKTIKKLELTFSNYKEPLKPVEKGFGYVGVLLQTTDGEKVQCHICGEVYSYLAPHVLSHHKMNVHQYRDKFQLARLTALCSEQERLRRKNIGQHLIDWARAHPGLASQQGKRAILLRKNVNWTERLESKNKRGTCPDQILDKIKKCQVELGHLPTQAEFVRYCGGQRYKHLVYTVFGSWNKALEAIGEQGRQKTNDMYSNDELLGYIRRYKEMYGTHPTVSDFSAGLLPSISTYRRRFGRMVNIKILVP